METVFENYSEIKLATLDWMKSYQKNHSSLEPYTHLGMVECFVKNFKEIIHDVSIVNEPDAQNS